MWLGKLTMLNMTPLGWLGRKTSTQTKDLLKFKDKYNQKLWYPNIYGKDDIF